MARHNLRLFRPDFSWTYHSGIIQKLRYIIGNFTVHYQDGMLECICKPGNKKETNGLPSESTRWFSQCFPEQYEALLI